MVNTNAIEQAKEHFGTVLEQQLARIEEMKQQEHVFRIIPDEFLGGKQSIPDLAGVL